MAIPGQDPKRQFATILAGRMRRREFITFLATAVASYPAHAVVQKSHRLPRIAIVSFRPVADEGRDLAFEETIDGRGWKDGKTVRLDYYWTSTDSLHQIAREVVGSAPNVIFAETTPVTAAVMQQTRSIPIVFVEVSDPIGNVFAQSFARPGWNVTGFTNVEFSTGSKWIGLLRELVPELRSVAVLYNPDSTPFAQELLTPLFAVAKTLAVQVINSPVRTKEAMKETIREIGREQYGGLICLPDVFTAMHSDLIIKSVSDCKIPAVYASRPFVTAGGLISYWVDTADLHRRAAVYIDQILRGASPADLPIEAPTKFELIINIETAKLP
jgi:putative tryptophan/tyrosine transport system substrate-binding protein